MLKAKQFDAPFDLAGATGNGVGRKASWLWRWVAVALAIVVAGTLSASLAAASVPHGAAEQSSRQFKVSSAQVTSTLQLAIQHEEDLIVSAAGFVAGNPGTNNAQFVAWAGSVQAMQRYPELLGFGHSVVVPASQLAAFEARAVADPAGKLAPGGRFVVVPPGKRPFYCFATGSETRDAAGAFPAGFDFCAGNLGEVSLAARDSGESAYLPIKNKSFTFLSVLTPIYRGGGIPKTVAARRRAFLGWVGMEVLPQVVLESALAGHPGIAVSMRYHDSLSNAVFALGKAAKGSQALSTDLHNGWTVTTSATWPAGVFSAMGTP